MKLTFLGANRQVTGSRYCVEANGSSVMIDCGMAQERAFLARNWESCPIDPLKLDALLLTHVHIDHCGLIPKLVAEGFRSPIVCTHPTVDLADVVLHDSARIQMEDAEYKQRRHRKEGRSVRHPEVPLYTEEDVDRTMPLLRGVAYREAVRINDVFTAVFHDAGHILGSAMIELLVREGDGTRRVIFSGDIGQWDKPLIRDPSVFDQADYVVMESTYGDRDHEDRGNIEDQLAAVINSTTSRGGSVVVPVFAVERAQEMMYHISRLVHAERIPHIQIFLDSPMAVDVTEIFRKYREYFDEETWQMIDDNQPPLRFPGLKLVRDVEESKAINSVQMPSVIMATSGMCTAGRIKHHLKHRISRPENTVLFVGYQGRETLGRQILEGKREVRILGRMHQVRARIAQIHGFSGHADRRALLRWLGALQQPPRRVFLTHGEEDVSLAFAETIAAQMNWPVHVPEYGESVTLD
ncbi:MAG: MBL fold metallo-hydrolase [Pirellulaceae bacterium]|nr:MBL fold metallo-hydrolase [Pirellulaceae bacterium]